MKSAPSAFLARRDAIIWVNCSGTTRAFVFHFLAVVLVFASTAARWAFPLLERLDHAWSGMEQIKCKAHITAHGVAIADLAIPHISHVTTDTVEMAVAVVGGIGDLAWSVLCVSH